MPLRSLFRPHESVPKAWSLVYNLSLTSLIYSVAVLFLIAVAVALHHVATWLTSSLDFIPQAKTLMVYAASSVCVALAVVSAVLGIFDAVKLLLYYLKG